MANINFLVYNTLISGPPGGYYRVVRYGICDSADLGGQAYESGDVAVNNIYGPVPEYYEEAGMGYYPIYAPSTNTLTNMTIPIPPAYDETLDPTNHRTQSGPTDSISGVLLKCFSSYGSFGLGGGTGPLITDFTLQAPQNGFYVADETAVIGGPSGKLSGGNDNLIVLVSGAGSFCSSFIVHRVGNTGVYKSWIGLRYSASATGPVTWQELAHPAQNVEYLWSTSGAAAGLWSNTIGAGAGTFTSELPTLTSKYTSMKRSLYSNVATTLNQVIGQRQSERTFFRGVAASGMGGFYFSSRFGFDTWTNGARFFAGLHTGTTVISADPSTLNNACGFAVDAADNGVIYFQTKAAAAATRVSTGMTIVSGKGYEIEVSCDPGGTAIAWKITDLNTGVVASGKATATLPATTVGNALGVLASNAALTAVNAVQLGVSRIYAETAL